MRIMVTGGGTGGHATPALAVVQELQHRDPRLLVQWVGCKGKVEERLCRRYSIPFRSVVMRGWPRKGLVSRGLAAFRLAVSLVQAAIYLSRYKPQVVFGVGGYVSAPLMLAAQRMNIPTILHEQNKRMGKANQLIAKRATRVLTSFPETAGVHGETRLVGNPVRADFLATSNGADAREAFGLDPDRPVLLVVGGSQGARSINRAVTDALEHFEPGEIQLVWMTGLADAANAREAVAKTELDAQVHGFIDDMAAACTAATLVLSRAGASTTAELAALGKPAILVPFPHAADNHQEDNARAFEARGAAVVLLDDECTGERLVETVRNLLRDPVGLDIMGEAARQLAAPGAADAIVEEIIAQVFPTEPRNPE